VRGGPGAAPLPAPTVGVGGLRSPDERTTRSRGRCGAGCEPAVPGRADDPGSRSAALEHTVRPRYTGPETRPSPPEDLPVDVLGALVLLIVMYIVIPVAICAAAIAVMGGLDRFLPGFMRGRPAPHEAEEHH
jgi:hypothetical protein